MVLACLALAVGLWQMFLGIIVLFGAGWAWPLVLAIILLPLLPLMLTQQMRPWSKLPPMVPMAAAVVSMAVSSLVYWVFYSFGD